MPVTRLLLVCHGPTGATAAGRFPDDEPLLDSASPRPLVLPPDSTALCGPERRTRETAVLLGLAPAVDLALRDCAFGRWAGRTLAEIATESPAALAAWIGAANAAPDGGESFAGVRDRIAGWLNERANLGGAVAAVTSPAVMRAAIAQVMGLGATESAAEIDIEPFAQLDLTHDGRRWRIRFRGSAGALAVAEPEGL